MNILFTLSHTPIIFFRELVCVRDLGGNTTSLLYRSLYNHGDYAN